MEEKKLRKQQQEVYDLMLEGENVFLSGDAGTGKSETLKKFICDMKSKGLKVLVCAPTGLAADNINGVTIHRAFDYPLGVLNSKEEKSFKMFDEEITIKSHRFIKSAIWKDIDIIIIDEISSVRLDLFQLITTQLMDENKQRSVEKRNPIQLIISGDFAQTKPVYSKDESKQKDDLAMIKKLYDNVKEGYAFESENWEKMNFITKHLTEIIRQEDTEFLHVLKCLRLGKEAGMSALKWLNEHITQKEWDGETIVLCGTKKEVDAINIEKYKQLQGKGVCFEEEYEMLPGYNLNDSDRRNSQKVFLKPGARVMCLVNDKDLRYTNGSLGSVVSVNQNTVEVKFDHLKETIKFNKYKWEIKNGKDEVVGEVSQIPLTLAYAITIHKVQGQTFDKICLKPQIYFDVAMHYVAVGRVKTLEGIQFYNGGFTDEVVFDSGYTRPVVLINDTVRNFLIENHLY